MALIFNILWFICGGFISWFMWCLAGCLLALTIIGLPFSFAAFRIARFSAFPFGKELVDVRLLGKNKVMGTDIMNFIWILLAGVWLSIQHLCIGISLALTIIGIPFALAHFKLAMVSFAPLGKEAVSVEQAASYRG